jgi:transcriptional regulator GlxA family with amidase domain
VPGDRRAGLGARADRTGSGTRPCRAWANGSSAPPHDAAGPQRGDLAERHGTSQRAVLRALELIEARLDQPWSRQDLADRVGLSLRHLERLFEAELGQSMTEAAMGIRLDEAAHRLRTTDGSITEIALDCGFASAATLSRRYRERFGVPPSQARPR